jgi:hypothetical protein
MTVVKSRSILGLVGGLYVDGSPRRGWMDLGRRTLELVAHWRMHDRRTPVSPGELAIKYLHACLWPSSIPYSMARRSLESEVVLGRDAQ